MTKIAIIVGSTRPGRSGTAVADWVHAIAAKHTAVASGEVTIDLVDIADFELPLLDEAMPALFGQYQNPHTLKWAEAVGSYDGFVFVTPEYNHSIPGSLKNALDYLYAEWQNKAAGFVGYGAQGGIRAVEHLRHILAELKVAGVRSAVSLTLFSDIRFPGVEDPRASVVVDPDPKHEETLHEMLSELIAWAGALTPLRETETVTA